MEWAKELQSLAQAGLFYGHDIYDKERYQRIREISAEMMLTRADVPAEKIKGLFCGDEGYQTPKVDTRAAIFRDGKILLVCEKGKWSMPGGWCEFNLSPADNIVKETKEEAGLDVFVKKVIAVQDRDKHNPPAVCVWSGKNILPVRGSWRRICRKYRDNRKPIFFQRGTSAFGRGEVQ